MDAVSIATTCYFAPCTGLRARGSRPTWRTACSRATTAPTPRTTGNNSTFVTAVLKNNGQTTYALKGGNSQSGGLTHLVERRAADRGGYKPMHQEGGIILGTGGDNSNWNMGTFFEGVMTSGYPTDAAENAVQANIVSVGYSGETNVPDGPQGTITGPGGKCVDVAGDDTGGNGAAVQLWDCQSYAETSTGPTTPTARSHPRPLPGHQRQRHGERHPGRAVGLQRRRRPEVGAAGRRLAAQPAVRPLPRLAQRRHRQRHPAADLGLQRHRRAEVRAQLRMTESI